MVRSSSKFLEWSKRLERFRQSGVSLSQFCKDEKVGVHSFYYWKKRLLAEVSDRSIALASVAKPSDVTPASQVRFTIHAGSIKIVCEAESLQGLDTVLSWVSRQPSSSMFHQLVVQG